MTWPAMSPPPFPPSSPPAGLDGRVVSHAFAPAIPPALPPRLTPPPTPLRAPPAGLEGRVVFHAFAPYIPLPWPWNHLAVSGALIGLAALGLAHLSGGQGGARRPPPPGQPATTKNAPQPRSWPPPVVGSFRLPSPLRKPSPFPPLTSPKPGRSIPPPPCS